MKSTLLATLVLFGLAGFTPAALAHIYQSSGTITVLLHTDPDDDVVAGQPAAMNFSVTDSSGKFLTQNCDCSVAVLTAQKELLNTPLLPVASSNTIFNFQLPFIFPSEGHYDIIFAGDPKQPGLFQAFSLRYPLDVKKDTPLPAPVNHRAGLVSAIIAILVLAGYGALLIKDHIIYPE